MSGTDIAAIIGAITVLLGTLGAAIKYVVQLILDAYKQQVTSTESAKNAEIAAKDAQINRHQAEIGYLRTENSDLRKGMLQRLEGQQ